MTVAGSGERIIIALKETADDDADEKSDETDENTFFHNDQVLLKLPKK